jgi:hypothetical protein
MPHAESPAAARRYFVASVLLWIAVDLGTAGGFRLSYLQKYGPALLVFYLGYPLVFTALVFRWRWTDARLLAATLAAIAVIEVVLTGNPLLMTFPAMLLAIPLALAVYAPLTFFPLWYVRGELSSHRRLVISLIAVEVLVTALTVLGQAHQ